MTSLTTQTLSSSGHHSPVVALYAGLNGIAQGLDQLVDTAELLHRRTNVTLAFVGDGPVRQELEAAKARRGLLSGHRNRATAQRDPGSSV